MDAVEYLRQSSIQKEGKSDYGESEVNKILLQKLMMFVAHRDAGSLINTFVPLVDVSFSTTERMLLHLQERKEQLTEWQTRRTQTMYMYIFHIPTFFRLEKLARGGATESAHNT